MQPFFPNPYVPQLAPPLPYGNSILLNELHTYFPALLYDSRRFRSVSDVSYYVSSEMRRRFDTFSSAQRAYRDSRPPPPPPVVPIPLRTPVQQVGRRTGNHIFFDETVTNAEWNQNIQTLFNTMIGLPASFTDPVLIIPTTAQLEAGSTVYHMITPSETPCAICQDVIGTGDVVRKLRGCNHMFHINCIDTWYQRSSQCPTCRHDIRSVQAPNPVATNASPVSSISPTTTTSQQHTNL
jgi:hypothetical protein